MIKLLWISASLFIEIFLKGKVLQNHLVKNKILSKGGFVVVPIIIKKIADGWLLQKIIVLFKFTKIITYHQRYVYAPIKILTYTKSAVNGLERSCSK